MLRKYTNFDLLTLKVLIIIASVSHLPHPIYFITLTRSQPPTMQQLMCSVFAVTGDNHQTLLSHRTKPEDEPFKTVT